MRLLALLSSRQKPRREGEVVDAVVELEVVSALEAVEIASFGYSLERNSEIGMQALPELISMEPSTLRYDHVCSIKGSASSSGITSLYQSSRPVLG